MMTAGETTLLGTTLILCSMVAAALAWHDAGQHALIAGTALNVLGLWRHMQRDDN